jgi:nucleoside-diphosphate-sugar epimerase
MAQNEMSKILVTGAVGQIGSELTMALRERYGHENVVAAGHRTAPSPLLRDSGPFETVDVCHKERLAEVVAKHEIDTIYHLAAILSAVGEQKPQLCWQVNMGGLTNVLEVARERQLVRIFCPSSIAVFGCHTPCDNTPQETILSPTTMYGVTKVAGEHLCDYYAARLNVDVRGVRYPGIISSETLPGGGTTDYAVAIYYEAIARGRYTCFVNEETVLPMMYMPDAIKAAIDLMETDRSRLRHQSNFNLTAMSFSAGELAAEIEKHIPGFEVTYEPDFRQAIADSWPRTIDDSAAREEWGWEPDYDLAAMTEDMLARLSKRHAKGELYPQS